MYSFHGENVCGLLAFTVPKDTMLPNFVEKLSRIATKLHKSCKSFSLESFSLYGTRLSELQTLPLNMHGPNHCLYEVYTQPVQNLCGHSFHHLCKIVCCLFHRLRIMIAHRTSLSLPRTARERS